MERITTPALRKNSGAWLEQPRIDWLCRHHRAIRAGPILTMLGCNTMALQLESAFLFFDSRIGALSYLNEAALDWVQTGQGQPSKFALSLVGKAL
mmetsp:Transcript_47501/g.152806  ORF Transcript_47501/g.152806 Transcript_47501/m.152806 type:complete len:95 (+) Transcript_47501:937-1221(+)